MAHYTHWRHRNKSVKLLLRPHLTALAEEAVAAPGIAAMSKLLETQASVKRPKKIIIDVESTWLILFDSCVFLRDLREKSIEATPQALHWCFSALSSSFVLLAHLDLASQGSRWKLLGECARRNDARLWTVLLWNFLLWWIKSQCIIVQGSATMTLGCLRSERSGQRSPKFLPFNSDNERTCEDLSSIEEFGFPQIPAFARYAMLHKVTQCQRTPVAALTAGFAGRYGLAGWSRAFTSSAQGNYAPAKSATAASGNVMIILWYNTFVICIIMYTYI
jgi:hypothetical protein